MIDKFTPQMPMTPMPQVADVDGGMARETPEPSPARSALVNLWMSRIRRAKAHHAPYFKRMREDQDFVLGKQWPNDPKQEKYVVNICDRHMHQMTASVYAKNPRIRAQDREQILGMLWDGKPQSLMLAQQGLMMAQQAGLPPDPTLMALAQEAEQISQIKDQRRRFAKTLELVYDYCIDEQPVPFKKGMKLVVRRAVTNGVGYVKLGFTRVLQPKPEVAAQMDTIAERMAMLGRLTEDFADGEFTEQDAEYEQLRLQLELLQSQQDVIAREGLDIDYPRSTSILIDPKCQNLATFMGADWVAHEYILTEDRIEEIYGIDIGDRYAVYATDGRGDVQLWSPTANDSTNPMANPAIGSDVQKYAAVYEIWSKRDGQVFVICDGYPEFLQEPAAPDVWTERFWPFFPLVLNDIEHEKELFPPSQIRLIRHQQMELNRCKEGLREHRKANRPKIAVAAGVLDEEDMNKLINHPSNAVLELSGLAPQQSVEALLQPIKMPGIDPNLYETGSILDDVLHVVGMQEANLGGTSDSTATESSIAESSRQSAMGSVMDDMDGLLSEFAKAAGQILMAEMSEQTVKEIAGQGAVWPQMSRAELARDIVLEIEAGSSGKPNKAQEIQNAQAIMPLLLQIPGIDPVFLAKDLLKRMDDRLDLDEALKEGMPSVASLNTMSKTPQTTSGGTEPGDDPEQQGGDGANNAPRPSPGQDLRQEQFPTPGEAVPSGMTIG